MIGLPNKFHPIFAVILLLSIGGFRYWRDAYTKSQQQSNEYENACVKGVTQSQQGNLSKEKIEKFGYFKIPKTAEQFQSEISYQFPSESRLLNSGATYIRMFFRVQKEELETWKPTLKLTKSSSEQTTDNEFSRMESRAWRQMIECKQDWWMPSPSEQSFRNFKSHAGTWLFDFSSAKDDPKKIDVYISGFMTE